MFWNYFKLEVHSPIRIHSLSSSPTRFFFPTFDEFSALKSSAWFASPPLRPRCYWQLLLSRSPRPPCSTRCDQRRRGIVSCWLWSATISWHTNQAGLWVRIRVRVRITVRVLYLFVFISVSDILVYTSKYYFISADSYPAITFVISRLWMPRARTTEPIRNPRLRCGARATPLRAPQPRVPGKTSGRRITACKPFF